MQPVPERRDGLDADADLFTQPIGAVTASVAATQPIAAVRPAAADQPASKASEQTPNASDKTALNDGLALSISGAIGSVAGLVSWIIAARIMPPADVGYASAFVSAFLLVAGVAQLNLDAGNIIWLPKSGRKAATLFWRSHLVIVPACIVVGLLYVVLFSEVLVATEWSGWPAWVGVTLFVAAAAGWGLWGLHDYTLVAVGKPWWAPGRSGAFAIARLGLLVVLGASLGPLGIVLSWVIPIVVWTIGSAGVAGFFAGKFSRAHEDEWLPSRKEVVTFLTPTTIAHWGTVLLANQVTIIVISRFGPDAGAAFFIAWQGVIVIEVAAGRFMQALSAQIARDPLRARDHIRSSRTRLFKIFVPMCVAGILAADVGLWIFGPSYTDAATVLRLLFIGMIPRLLIAHELGVRQAMSEGMGFARLQLVSTLLVIAAVLFVPAASSGGEITVQDLWPLAVGYTAAQIVCAAYIMVIARRRKFPVAETPAST
jgi:O-antigen/teichoic acid export membrane protein